MKNSELKELQRIQTHMLADFDTFCKKYDLRYYLFYGTLLGAIRHSGFIPWDYDIDIAMTRLEYKKFMYVRHLLPPHLQIWDVCYSDIKHAGLSRIIYHDEKFGGVHVDIFILDYEKQGVPTSLCRFLHFAKLSHSEKSILIKHFSGQPQKQLVVYLSKIAWLLLGGSANIERLVYKLRVNKTPSSHYITLEDYASFPVEYFMAQKELKFDEYLFPGPTHADELLTEMYGNYMEIPPEGLKWMKEEGLKEITMVKK